MIKKLSVLSVFVIVFLLACQSLDKQVSQLSAVNEKKDPHTQSNYTQVRVTHLDLDLKVNFDNQILQGIASWKIEHVDSGATKLILDTYHLKIDSVTLNQSEQTLFKLNPLDTILGQALIIEIKPNTQSVQVYYSTTANATALQWLMPSQTSGKKHPFLFTQSESIYARSWIPCQDGPGIRFTYTAKVNTPKYLMPLMSAINPPKNNGTGHYYFEMSKPIPAYLMALAVGDIQSKVLSNRTTVYAEPLLLDKAAKEIEHIETMMQAAEQLYGAYEWGRYDVLFMPAGFPFGGMENPLLTFSTPTILAGDKSLVNLIAHELAHSWSGNLVTNATWNDFWLNESFTVYFERRIMEALNGKSYADMLWNLGYQDLKNSTDNIFVGDLQSLSKLRLDLSGKDPDLGLSDIAYEKGAHLLLLIEQKIGRAAMDVFLKKYFNAFAFKSITTSQFVSYVDSTLFKDHKQLSQQIAFDTWINDAGLPSNCPIVANEKFAKVNDVFSQFQATKQLDTVLLHQWSTYEWLHFLRQLKPNVQYDEMAYLDSLFHLTQKANAEVATVWFVLSVKAQYKPAFDKMHQFLNTVGRMKFLEPIYEAMSQSAIMKSKVWEIYNSNKSQYHPLTQKSVERFLPPKS
mgnify:CR=1 FL=1